MTYEAELQFAVSLARKAGELMRVGLDAGKTVWKADHTPLTETDSAINDLVIDTVRLMYPDDGILGEEASFEPDRSRRWVVDPVDGTQAFDVGAPVATFCLGLVTDDEPVLGVVYDPFMDRLYSAVKGQGTYMNGEAIHASTVASLDRQYTFVSSRMGGSHLSAGEALDVFIEAGAKCFSFRSVVYGFMRVACGRAAVALAGPSYPWDFTAAKVILDEAGAVFTDLDGKPVDYADASHGGIASSPVLHQEIVELVRSRRTV